MFSRKKKNVFGIKRENDLPNVWLVYVVNRLDFLKVRPNIKLKEST